MLNYVMYVYSVNIEELLYNSLKWDDGKDLSYAGGLRVLAHKVARKEGGVNWIY